MPYDLRNSSVFSARLNASSDGSEVIARGSVFQTFAAATGKARSPTVSTEMGDHVRVQFLERDSYLDT